MHGSGSEVGEWLAYTKAGMTVSHGLGTTGLYFFRTIDDFDEWLAPGPEDEMMDFALLGAAAFLAGLVDAVVGEVA